jgi:hypothetical protein
MANAYLFTWESAERLTREWLEVLARDYSHPSIVAWVPINESWGVPGLESDPRQRAFLLGMYNLTKAFDATRPVVDNEGWEHMATDIVGIHDYAKTGNSIRERFGCFERPEEIRVRGGGRHHRVLLPDHQVPDDRPVMLTEFGGISYAPRPDEPWFGYGTVSTGEEYLAKLRELVDGVRDCPGLAGFCYTQLTDTEQETNGLLHADRSPKFDPLLLSSIFGER